jgi:hypothetical protein
MKKLLLFIATVILFAGCTEMTVDTDKVSSRVSLNPSFVVAVSGEVNLGDLIQPGDTILDPRDTILFDETGLMKIFVYEDSLIDLSVSDFYSGFPDESFSGTYDILSTGSELIEEAIDIDPGEDIELKTMKITMGEISYSISSTCTFPVDLVLTLNGVYDETLNPIEQSIPIGANSTANGIVNLDGALADFTLDATQPYNRIVVSGLVTPGGNGSEPMGSVSININVPEPEYDYVTGYFGMQTEEEENDTIDLDLGEIFAGNSNAFYLANPIMRMHYRNSFGLPIEISPEASGITGGEPPVNLNRAPVNLVYPASVEAREEESAFVIDKDNSDLPDIISMLPDQIIIGGSVTTNPLGDVGQDNIVFSDSRLTADLEVEIPMEFWMDNLVLSDTIESFLLPDEDDGESPFDYIDQFELRMFIENGFPLGGNISITLYDSANAYMMSSIETGDFFDPAPVDANGVVTSPSEKSTVITLTDEFKNDSYVADKMIIKFTFNTTEGSSQAVKLMSDYSIYFRAGLVIRAGFDVYLNNGDDEE